MAQLYYELYTMYTVCMFWLAEYCYVAGVWCSVMAVFTNPASRQPSSSTTRSYHLGYDAYSNDILGGSTTMTSPGGDPNKINIFILFVFILELLVLVFVCVLEYFLRWAYKDLHVSRIKSTTLYNTCIYIV